MKRMLSCVLAVAVAFAVCIFPSAKQTDDYTYDNSLVVDACFSGQSPAEFFADMDGIESIITARKMPGNDEGSFLYRFVLTFSGDLDETKNTLSQKPGVSSVETNFYCDDWFKRELNVRLSSENFYVRVGRTYDLTYTVDKEILDSSRKPEAMLITVDPEKFDMTSMDEQTLTNNHIPIFCPVEEGVYIMDKIGSGITHYGYNNIKSGQASPSNTYLLVVQRGKTFINKDAVTDFRKGDSIDYPRYADALLSVDGIETAEILYNGDIMGPDFITDSWENYDEQLAEMTLSGGKKSYDSENSPMYEQTATFKGLECGYGGGAMIRGDGIYKFNYTVFLPGDTDGNSKLAVSDALVALQSVVGKVTLDEPLRHAADMNEDGNVTVTDALLILRSAVNEPTV